MTKPVILNDEKNNTPKKIGHPAHGKTALADQLLKFLPKDNFDSKPEAKESSKIGLTKKS